jgi:hypothetical protein
MPCFREQGRPSDEAIELEFSHDDKLIAKCSRGHEAPIGVQEQDFEILFDLGCMAVLDGYSREAVTSIAVALERAYLFYVNCILAEAKLPQELQDSFLSQVSRQSERQLGAFLALFTLHEGGPPPLLAKKWIEFRNDCVHKGIIPATSRVLEYAEAVLNVMDHLVGVLKSRHAEGLGLEIHKHLVSAGIEGTALTTMSIPTIVSFTRGTDGGTFSARLDGLKKYRQWLWLN